MLMKCALPLKWALSKYYFKFGSYFQEDALHLR
jgi:hypothetical protein